MLFLTLSLPDRKNALSNFFERSVLYFLKNGIFSEIALQSDHRADDLGTCGRQLDSGIIFVGKAQDIDTGFIFAQISDIALTVDFHHEQRIRADLRDRSHDQQIAFKDALVFETGISFDGKNPGSAVVSAAFAAHINLAIAVRCRITGHFRFEILNDRNRNCIAVPSGKFLNFSVRRKQLDASGF